MNDNVEDYEVSYANYEFIDADTDQVINTVDGGFSTDFDMEILTDQKKLSIRAVVPNSDISLVKRVIFSTDDGVANWSEGVAPYVYKGDNSGDYTGYTPTLGSSVFFTVKFYNVSNVTSSTQPIYTDTFRVFFVDEPVYPPSYGVNEISENEIELSFSAGNINNQGSFNSIELSIDGIISNTLTPSGYIYYYTVTNLLPNRTYLFSAVTINSTGVRSVAYEVSATTSPSAAPEPPTNLTFSTPINNTTTLSWSASTTFNIVAYNIYRNGVLIPNSSNTYTSPGSGTSYTITNLSTSTTDTFSVKAIDSLGNESISSNVITIDNIQSNNDNDTTQSYWIKPNNSQDIHYIAGNVGIGIADPGIWKLAVNGKIRTKEIKVESNWADYVFEKGYHLPTLQQVETHIQEKGHLINIPSAAEVEANGIELGVMNKLLLEKIEEATLYILQNEKRIKFLETLK